MVKALSIDLRERVVAAVCEGVSCHKAAARFGVSVSSAIRWVAAWRLTGSVAPKWVGGDRSSHHLEQHAGLVLEAVEEQVDITIAELQALLKAHGIPASYGAVWNLLVWRLVWFQKSLNSTNMAGRIDPTGECFLAGFAGGATSGAAISLRLQLYEHNGNLERIDWGEVAREAAIIGAFGLTCGVARLVWLGREIKIGKNVRIAPFGITHAETGLSYNYFHDYDPFGFFDLSDGYTVQDKFGDPLDFLKENNPWDLLGPELREIRRFPSGTSLPGRTSAMPFARHGTKFLSCFLTVSYSDRSGQL